MVDIGDHRKVLPSTLRKLLIHLIISSSLLFFFFNLVLVKTLSLPVRVYINNQESHVINGANTTKCFPFKRSVCQGDPITDTFILRLEVLFILIKSDPNIKVIEIFLYCKQLMQMTKLFS